MRRKRANPFTVLLGVVGVLFTLTATCYGVAVLRGVRPETARSARHGLDALMARHGTTALVVELALLAIATVGSIAVDEIGFREVRRQLRESRPPEEPPRGSAGETP